MNRFWYRWMQAWCLYVAVFGVILLAGAFEATDWPVRVIISLLRGGEYEMSDYLQFGVGIQGALSLALAILVYGFLKTARRHRLPDTVWRMPVAALLVWFVADGIVSVATGFWLNVASNTFILAMFLIPLPKLRLSPRQAQRD